MRTSLLIAALVLAFGPFVAAAPAASDKPTDDLNVVSLETRALLTLHRLQLTQRQMESLASLAKGTAAPAGERETAKTSDRFRKTLLELRDALRKDSDDDRIDELAARIEELRENEEADIDDDVELTDTARERAAELFRVLKPRQVVAFLGDQEDDVPDPMERLLDTVRRKDKLTAEEWKGACKLTAEEVAWLVGGVDKARAERVRDQVVEFLERSHKLSEADLEKGARHIVGDLAPTDVLRNYTTHALADLLSNPQLHTVLKARSGAK
jgi:hypothetical protein